jgi:AGCS family alanine or glycine:cation symporter
LGLVRRENDGGDGVSTFGVLCTALSAAIGTGNIIGVATAVTAGGPGALFWMLVAAFFGMATKYAEGLLAVKFRRCDQDGYKGGPFYYIEYGMGRGWRWLGKIYALFGALAGLLGIGTLTQSNSITAAVGEVVSADRVAFSLGEYSYSWVTVIVGGVVTVGAALVILGGIRRIARVAEVIVPIMLCVYVVLITVILITYAQAVPSALSLMVRSAFAPQAALGAAAGVTVKNAVRMGVGRGVFSNEAGLGTEAIAAAAARSNSPVRQGLVCMVGTLIDTVVLCTVAGLVLIVTGAYRHTHLQGIELTRYAWQQGLPFPPAVSSCLLMLCLSFFAFSTILGWNYYAEQCMSYLCGGRTTWMRAYRLMYIFAVWLGPYLSVSSVWTVADICNGCMAFPNLIALVALSGVVVRQTREYFSSG